MLVRTKTHFITILTSLSFVLIFSPISFAQDYTELDCLIKPEMYIDVSSPSEGVLASVAVKKGDNVKRGQILAKLESSIEQAKVDIARHEAMMDNKILAQTIRLEYALRKEARVEGLKDNALSEQEYDDARTEVLLAKTELRQTMLDQQHNEFNLALVNAELELKTITSPVNGIVVERYLMPGESTINQAILQLAKIDPLLIEVVAPYKLFGLIELGMSVDILPELPINSQYQATVSVIDRIIDAASGSFSIRLALPNPDNTLIGGTKCIARFPVPQAGTISSANTTVDNELPDDIKKLLSSQ